MIIAIDTETELITPGNLTPRLVCMSAVAEYSYPVLWDRHESPGVLETFLRQNHTLAGHNIAFDLAVLQKAEPKLTSLIWQAYDENRIYDTRVAQKLSDIAKGTLKQHKYHLADLSVRLLGRELKKGEDTWRLRYGELIDVPKSQWPGEAINYALLDAQITLDAYKAQSTNDNSRDIWNQTRAAWALHLMSARGICTDSVAVNKLEMQLTTQYYNLQAPLIKAGVIRQTKTGFSKDLKAIQDKVMAALPDCRTTEKRGAATDADTLLLTRDPVLKKLVEFKQIETLLKRYIPVLRQGTETPINARYNELVETGRTSCSSPNLQNLPRGPQIRECFTSRPGTVFIHADYDTAELRALAQIHWDWYRKSSLREAFIADQDPHMLLAAKLNPTNPKLARQFAKIGNYGLAGGMVASSLVDYARGYGIDISLRQAQEIYAAFFQTWPEMRYYFQDIKVTLRKNNRAVYQAGSQRKRGCLSFCAAANTHFQGLIADGAKAALYEVSKDCYIGGQQDTYPVVFLHDEIIAEAPADGAVEAADWLGNKMQSEMQKFLPAVPVKAEGKVMGPRWLKN